MLYKMKKIIKNPYKILAWIVSNVHFIGNSIPDETYLKIKYRGVFGKKLDLHNPKTFNEKLQWLKLYDRNPKYTIMVDKYAVKDYVASLIGEQYIIPTLGVWDKFEEIDFEILPEEFVLKCTHDSGSTFVCKDKSQFDISEAKEKLESCRKRDFYAVSREWVYKDVPPRIIAEAYIGEVADYKLMMFNGKLRCSFVCTNRNSEKGLHVTFYDPDWNIMPFERHYPKEEKPIPCPMSYTLMCELAQKLSVGIPFVRVDFYEILGKPYFSELTFFPGAGWEEFTPEEWDVTLGSWLTLLE